MRQEGEPSVDQLLQSIKKVMARETRPVAEPAPATDEDAEDERETGGPGYAYEGSDPFSREPPQPEPSDADEALELRELTEAEELHAPGSSLDLAAAPPEAQTAEADELIENEADGEAEMPLFSPEDSRADGEAEMPPPKPDDSPAATAGPSDEALVSGETAASIRRSLAALAMLSEPGAPRSPNLPGAAELDGLAREMLRPMLAQWLETHLPAMVERELKAEIARITGSSAG